jgi:hypothetical protein
MQIFCAALKGEDWAERGGFEPPVPGLGVHLISSQAHSTALASFRGQRYSMFWK